MFWPFLFCDSFRHFGGAWRKLKSNATDLFKLKFCIFASFVIFLLLKHNIVKASSTLLEKDQTKYVDGIFCATSCINCVS